MIAGLVSVDPSGAVESAARAQVVLRDASGAAHGQVVCGLKARSRQLVAVLLALGATFEQRRANLRAARDSYLTAVDYTQQRMQFGKPLAGYQLTQEKLVNMALEIDKGTLLALHLGRLKDAGTLQPHQISVGKLNNCREAIQICRDARAMLGGNGITLDYSPMRHANNLESVRTYEGTDEVHTLVIGQALTGISAFRG